ncbi:uncharacterized protein EAF01_005824 [Botrytis porri]|uniref:uncharacterized protein n=1 Tax=Botrytis porri TaxID=87229 RepID=UPI0018FF365C|nr:uncharacterized protein EAF01_005824 [Botrytis porri]KAF7905303.1 hypothetical protein EAF01_005824 [Botrytis porri]
MAYPKNVGIKAMEIYVPAQCLDQTLFEQHQGVSAGKYTIGLGLQYMNFCTDREDVCSLALTAVSSLLRKFNIDPKSIGRLEVGTESPIDKAKSVKSVLTTLFEPHGNTSLEGIDTTHACYGGTNALFNAVNWVESRSWDGRDAIVVASDIALYKEAASRPTGGAGCVAMLVGPNALLSLESGLKGVYMTHAYDFYKPDTKVEFPIVNGHESIGCYIGALDACIPDELRKLSYSESLKDKTLEKTLIEITKDEFKKRVEPCIAGASLCGNMYTGSLYFSLMSLINNIDLKAAEGKTIGLFSFGSGIASSLFGMKITGDLTDLVQKVNLMDRLKQRHTATPEEYEEACTLRRNAYGAKDFRPLGDVNSLVPGTYYLENVDDVYRRTYAIKK